MTKIIAELSGNHGGDLCRCLDMIVAAKHSGCWAAKFQLYRPEDLPDFDPKSNLPVPPAWLKHMFAVANQNKIELFASIFAVWAIDELICYTHKFKIASRESTRLSDDCYIDLNEYLPYGSTVFISHSREDAVWARKTFNRHGLERFWLYCKAGYPATITMDDLKEIRGCHGFSDHTAGIIAPLAMVGAGAEYIEKHFKLDDNCMDAAFSLNPDEMKTLCELTK